MGFLNKDNGNILAKLQKSTPRTPCLLPVGAPPAGGVLQATGEVGSWRVAEVAHEV